ncbi:hypothetical protein PPACK8108_LOCUS2190 [Phakopsora pachyrhizi]|uniref:Uncharacterized protein n=1 Tax=Phakopsora pachyrhizi TaxID=170000 RepID=A0AAV0ALA6_PHAPC|nr:hypothetical protein PPACK8108_LOCUS2190 [Phakopsora pachyrhizi]
MSELLVEDDEEVKRTVELVDDQGFRSIKTLDGTRTIINSRSLDSSLNHRYHRQRNPSFRIIRKKSIFVRLNELWIRFQGELALSMLETKASLSSIYKRVFKTKTTVLFKVIVRVQIYLFRLLLYLSYLSIRVVGVRIPLENNWTVSSCRQGRGWIPRERNEYHQLLKKMKGGREGRSEIKENDKEI